jgi:molybdopterin synthase catalytic subunit
MFKLVSDPMNFLETQNQLYKAEAGGVVCFEGRVRNHNFGKIVTQLNYEAFDEMAITEGNKILAEAQAKFKIVEAKALHRVGTLQIEETAMWVGVSAAHREAAFLACQYIIDQIKSRVPIWKKEFYADDTSDWVKCLACSQKGIPHSDQNHFHHVENK